MNPKTVRQKEATSMTRKQSSQMEKGSLRTLHEELPDGYRIDIAIVTQAIQMLLDMRDVFTPEALRYAG